MSKKYYLLLFLIFFLFYYFHLQGLPTGGFIAYDLAYTRPAETTESYSEILKILFVDRAPFFHTWCSYDCTLYRPTSILFWKIITDVFGFNTTAVYITRSVTVAVLSLFVFYFIEESTKKKWIALLGSLFFITTPPLFSAALNLGDTEIFAELLLSCSLLFFYKFVYTQPHESRKKILLFICFIFLMILTTHTRETTKIIYPILIIMILFFYRKDIWWFIAPLFLFIYYSSLEIGTSGQSGYSFITIIYRVFAFPGNDYPLETFTLLSLTQHIMQVPVSLLSQLGFFFGYFILISLILLIFFKRDFIKKMVYCIKNSFLEAELFMFIFSSLMLILTIIAYGFFESSTEHRYFIVGILPLTYFIFLTANIVANRINKYNIKLYKVYLFLFISTATIAIIVNAYHVSIHMRGGTVGYLNGKFEANKIILSDYNNINYTSTEVSLYLSGFSISHNITLNSSNVYYVREVTTPIYIFNESQLGQEPVYIVNFLSNSILVNTSNNYTIELIGSTGGCLNDKTIYCRVKNKFITPENSFFIFKITKHITR